MLKLIKLKFSSSILNWILGVIFITPLFSYSQENLIINGNCDIYDSCPQQLDQLNHCLGWSKFGEIETPNFLSQCSSNPNTSIPHYWGYQLPLSGDSYIMSSILMVQKPTKYLYYTNELGYIQSREAIKGTLTRPLNPVTHKIEFYVNFIKIGYNDGMGNKEGYVATDAFDLILLNSNETVYNSASPFIDSYKIFNINKSGNIINDTLNWVKITGCFIPNGNETFFAIGAFRDTIEINLEFSGESYSNEYPSSYYLDNFSITECDTCCLGEFPYTDHVNVSNNPSSSNNPTTFTIVLNANTSATLDIYDSAGRLVARNEFHDLLSNYQVDAQLAMGVYHYVLRTSNGVTDVGKVLVSL